MINVDDLLKPVAEDKPCGEDFTYDPSFQKLETLARGKPETQFSPAEEPDWKEVRDGALEVLGKSKHLSAAVILTVALLKTGKLEGLRDGLAVARGLTEKYWNDLYPKLDPADNNDPMERLNLLNNLSSNVPPYKFITQLKQLVICESPSLGRFTVQQVLSAREKSASPVGSEPDKAAASGPDMNQVQAAFRDAGTENAQKTLVLVNELIGHAEGIDTFLNTTLGAGKGVNFGALSEVLGVMKSTLEPFATDGGGGEGGGGETAESAPDGESGGGQATRRTVQGVSGAIQSRADVVKALGLICDYYRTNEPSSPVPLILLRAQRLVDKDFMTIMNDLTPDALTQLRVITGTKEEEK